MAGTTAQHSTVAAQLHSTEICPPMADMLLTRQAVHMHATGSAHATDIAHAHHWQCTRTRLAVHTPAHPPTRTHARTHKTRTRGVGNHPLHPACKLVARLVLSLVLQQHARIDLQSTGATGCLKACQRVRCKSVPCGCYSSVSAAAVSADQKLGGHAGKALIGKGNKGHAE